MVVNSSSSPISDNLLLTCGAIDSDKLSQVLAEEVTYTSIPV